MGAADERVDPHEVCVRCGKHLPGLINRMGRCRACQDILDPPQTVPAPRPAGFHNPWSFEGHIESTREGD